MEKNKEKTETKSTSSSGFMTDFLMSFTNIFKYFGLACKSLFSVLNKPITKKNDPLVTKKSNDKEKTNQQTTTAELFDASKAKFKGNTSLNSAISQSTKKVDTNITKKSDKEPKGFLDKIWKILNSDLGGKGPSKAKLKKISEQKRALLAELSNPNLKRSEVAKVFVYKARTTSGKIETGRLFGFSKMDINAFLLNEGLDPYSIENNSLIDFLYGDTRFSSRKMKNKDIIFFLTQLSTYVKAGITLTDSMKILMNQSSKDKTKKGIYQSIVYELTMGSSFSEAMNKQGSVFPPLLVNMLKAAEATGELEETLDDMVDYYTDIESTRKEMISAMTYPALVTVFAMGVIAFILMYVIPQFSDIYDSMDVEISGLTQFLLNLSMFLQNYFFIIILVIALIIIVIVAIYKKLMKFRKTMQTIFMKMPILGNIIIYNEMTVFAKTFSSLLRNNVNITESIDILSKITNNEIYKEIMITTINNIAVGDRISEAFKDHWAIPEVSYYMIVTGESTGQLAEMMSRVAAFYQEQHRNLIANLKSMIEPVMIISLAVIVGTIIIAVIVPMFDMYNDLTLGGS